MLEGDTSKKTTVIVFLLMFIVEGGCIRSSVNGTLPSFLAVADYTNNRALLFRQWPSSSNQPADIVLGQPNYTSNIVNNGGISASTMNAPTGLCGDASHLYVVEQNNHRVTCWNTVPSRNGQPADIVLGQPSFFVKISNNGGIAKGLSGPSACSVIGPELMVADALNNRILVWTSLPTSTYQPPVFALGQPNLFVGTPNTGSIGASTLSINAGSGIATDGAHLVVGDANNNRVLIWTTLPSFSGQPANLVLGQPDFVSNLANNGGAVPSASTLSNPLGILILNGRLLVADEGNNRILIWNTFPASNQQSADVEIGQTDMNTNSLLPVSPSQIQYGAPWIATDGRRLFVSATYDHRVLIFNSLPNQNFQAADLVLGQVNFYGSSSNEGGVTSQQSVSHPGGVFSNAVYFGTQTPWGY